MFQPDLLAGKRVLITGGGTGLGKSMARRFMELGADTVLVGRRGAVVEATAKELSVATGRAAVWRALDIRDPDAVEAAVTDIWTERPIDVLVNNAAGNFLARSEDLSPRAVDAVVGIVLHGTAYMTLACGKRWIAAKRPGTVLSIVTSYAWTGSAYVVPSAMGKAGVLAMTRSLAVEWGPKGVRLNAIAPGPFPTEGAWERLVPRKDLADAWLKRIPLGRAGDHHELANLATYLIADGSAYVNGDVITIDGGEWLAGAGQFNFASMLSNDDWEELKPKKK